MLTLLLTLAYIAGVLHAAACMEPDGPTDEQGGICCLALAWPVLAVAWVVGRLR